MQPEVVFGQWLKRRRTALDLTQEELAERIGCSRETVQKIEAGARRPSKQIAALLADCVSRTPEERTELIQWARHPADPVPESLAASSLPVDSIPPSPHVLESPSRTNLPTPLTSLVGREDELDAIGKHLLRDDIRLLTLIGPPGIGKTRLGIAAAARVAANFPDGVYFVALESLNDADLVIAAIAKSVGLKQSGNLSTAGALARHLQDKRALLVLDNFEQVLDAGPQILQLLSGCPYLNALITSRESLHAYGEWRFHIPPLGLPQRKSLRDPEKLARVASIILFADRAQALKPDFGLTARNVETIAAICIRLDGLPLAIELAAARIESLTPEQILAGLENRLKFLRGGLRYLPARQQTLRGAIDWSYNLLSPRERTLFRRLGVFAGGCNPAAVEAVCNSNKDLPFEVQEGISSLVGKSLMYQATGVDGEPRLGMLESIHEYARERLESSGEAQEIQRRHAEYCVERAEATNPQLWQREQVKWLRGLEQDEDNIRAALAWTTDPSHDATELALRLSAAQGKFWYMRGRAAEGRQWLEAALALPVSASSAENAASDQEKSRYSSLRAKVLRALGVLAFFQGDYEAARSHGQAALMLAQEAGDQANMAACLMNLGVVASTLGEYAQARELLWQALELARKVENKPATMLTLDNLGQLALALGDNPSARSFSLEALNLQREMGDRYSMAYTLMDLAEVAIEEQNYTEAETLLEESLSTLRQVVDELGVGRCLFQFANLARARGNYQKASELYRDGLVLSRKVGDRAGVMDAMQQQAELCMCLGEVAKAVRLWSVADMISQAIGTPTRAKYLPRYEQGLADARHQLGEEVFERIWAAVRSEPFEQAIDHLIFENKPS